MVKPSDNPKPGMMRRLDIRRGGVVQVGLLGAVDLIAGAAVIEVGLLRFGPSAEIGSDGHRTIEVVTSEEIVRGGCRLETESGIVDATIPTQIDEIRRQLLDTEL